MFEPLQYGNLYQNYYTPYFCGDANSYAPAQSSGYQTSPQYDTVELSNKQEEPKKELSTTAKAGLFSLAAIALTVAADYIFAKGKHVNGIIKTFKGESKQVKDAAQSAAESAARQKAAPVAEPQVKPAQTPSNPAPEPVKPKAEETPLTPTPEPTKTNSKKKAKSEKTNNSPEAKTKVDDEAKAKAAKEPEEKAAKDAEAKAAEEAKKKADAEAARRAKKQTEFEKALDFSKKYVDEHMAELDKVMLDKDGKLHKGFITTAGSISLDDLIRPYNGNVEYFYHATTPEVKAKILKEGFNQRIAPKHGYLDGVGGTYFSIAKDPDYGSAVIKAKFNGKIAEVDTNLLDNIKTGNNMRMYKHLTSKGLSEQEASDYGEAVIREYLQRKIFDKGYQGIVGSGHSYAAGCKYFAALDPKLIQIVE